MKKLILLMFSGLLMASDLLSYPEWKYTEICISDKDYTVVSVVEHDSEKPLVLLLHNSGTTDKPVLQVDASGQYRVSLGEKYADVSVGEIVYYDSENDTLWSSRDLISDSTNMTKRMLEPLRLNPFEEKHWLKKEWREF